MRISLAEANERAIKNWKVKQGKTHVTSKVKKQSSLKGDTRPPQVRMARVVTKGTTEIKLNKRTGLFEEVIEVKANNAWGYAAGTKIAIAVENQEHYQNLHHSKPDHPGEECNCGIKH